MAIYEFSTRIRYSEVDTRGHLSCNALVDLFQNCSTFQSEDLGVGIDFLLERHRAWVLSYWQISLENMPKCGDEVSVQTWSYGIKHALGYRNFALRSAEGELLSCANSLWAYIDTDTGRPIVADQEEIDLYGMEEPLEMEKYPRKIALSDNMKRHSEFEVPYFFLDTNQHMNNGKYILAASKYLPEDFKISTIRAEYKKSAMLHDIIVPYVDIDDKCVTVALRADNDSLYSSVQFISE